MKRVAGILLSRWAITLLGTALLALLVWFFGPLLAVLAFWPARLGVVLLLVAIWAAANLLLDLRARRRDTALAEGIADGAPDAREEQAAAVHDRFAAAIAVFRKASGRRGYLFEQPWYAIIGPPGAGKTTLLRNSGLNFPLAAEMGDGAVAGVGGTRLCDWWLAEEAVLIDTAGRYTTQDSDAAVDAAGWDAFLDTLKRTRGRRPLNGVLVAIAASDVAALPEDERIPHARSIRQRIRELEARLRVRLPVYLLFTKSDLIAGFTEFFSTFDRDRCAQVWGTTFALKPGPNGPIAGFGAAFRTLVERLNAQLLPRLQEERSPDRRALIAGFPAQFASLEPPLTGFLQAAFGGSRLDPAPFLRGIYFTSGTQQGTPLDRLTGLLANAFGLDQRRLPSLRPEHGRSYFLARLLREVVFGEAMLVAEPPGAARRRLLLRGAAFGGVLLAVVVAAGLLWRGSLAGQQRVALANRAFETYAKTAGTLPLDRVSDADFLRLLPLLDQAAALPYGSAQPGGEPGFGLSQDAKLRAAARTVYRNALDNALLPRLVWRLETTMRGAIGQPDVLYQATRVYLMLGGEGPLDAALVHQWMAADWEATYPGAIYADQRSALLRHLDALLAASLPPVPLDGALVGTAQAVFSHITLAQRVYARIRPSAAAQALSPWRPSDIFGSASPAAVLVFARASGKPLTEGIPGFLTREGFHRVLLPSLGEATARVAGESWVLGKTQAIDRSGPAMRSLEADVVQLYEADFIAAWDALLNDLEIAPFPSPGRASEGLSVLTSNPSPMQTLLTAIAGEVTLSVPPEGPKPGDAKPSALPHAVAAAQANEPNAAPPGREVDEHYKALRDFVGNGSGAPLGQVMKSLTDIQQELAKIAAAQIGSTPPPAPTGSDPVQALRVTALQVPQPLQRWLQSIAAEAAALRGGNARQQIVAAYNGTGGPGPLCTLIVDGRYPFTPTASADVPLGDFGRLFAPGGQLDAFFNTELHPYVDMSGKTWTLQQVAGTAAPITPGDLAQFQRAAAIRDLFFANGGNVPGLRFEISPATLDGTPRRRRSISAMASPSSPSTGRRGRPRSPGPGRNRCRRCASASTRRPPAAAPRCRRPGPGRCSACSRRRG